MGIHGESKRLEQQIRLAERELSPKNFQIVEKFRKNFFQRV